MTIVHDRPYHCDLSRHPGAIGGLDENEPQHVERSGTPPVLIVETVPSVSIVIIIVGSCIY